jgi:Pentapeptide repeats (8 copies)
VSDLFEPHSKPLHRASESKDRPRPKDWSERRRSVRRRWLIPLVFVDWLSDWAAYALSRLSLLELLEYCGSFSILIAVIFYFVDAPERTKTKHYQAWQVINTAQGKGGSGGRIEALQELNQDRVPLVGVDVSEAYLQDVKLVSADLRRGDLHAADLRRAVFRNALMEGVNLRSANLRGADFDNADLHDANLYDADLTGARLVRANLHGASLERADLRNCDLAAVRDWDALTSIRLANIHGVTSAPAGFIAWAKAKGAVDLNEDADWEKALAAEPATKPSQPMAR